jgi:predicted DNA-binding transcriptional regulator AlpA
VSNLAPTAPRELLTIPEVARLACVSERTVWGDIKDRRLTAIRRSGRTYVPRSALATYRMPSELPGVLSPGAHAACAHLLTYRQVAALTQVDVRTVKRRAQAGAYVLVRFGPRCLRIDAQRTFVSLCRPPWGGIYVMPSDSRSDFGRMSLAELQAKGPNWMSTDQPWVVDVRVETLVGWSEGRTLNVPGLAQLCGKSKRQVYYEVKKLEENGALPVERRGRAIRIQLRDAIAYAGRADVTAKIISTLVNLVSDGDSMVEKAEISRRFKAWLVAHPPEVVPHRWRDYFRSAR